MSRAEGRRDALTAAAVFAVLACVYWVLRCRSFGPGDSPQHVLSALTWGVSVAPGYPLYVMLGKLFSLLPFGAPAANVNGLSGLLHAATAAVFFVLLRAQGAKPLPALIATALLAFSRLFWYYSEIAEVRALNDFLAASSALLAVLWTRERKAAWLLCLAGYLGLGLGHHPTFVLILPAIAYWLWAKGPRASPGLLAGALACLVVYCAAPYLVLWRRLQLAPAAWNPAETKTLRDVWRLFTRQAVGGPLRMVVGSGVFGFGRLDLARLGRHALWFASACLVDVHAGLVLAALGLRRLWAKDRPTAVFWLLWTGVTAAVFIGISSQQLILCDAGYVRGMVARFYLLPLLGLFALAAFGAARLLERVRPAFGWALLAACAAPALARPMDLSRHDALRDYCDRLIASTGPGDMLVLGPDDTILALSLRQLAFGQAADRVLLVPSLFSSAPYIRRLHREQPGLALPPLEDGALTTDWRRWLEANPKRRLFVESVMRDTVLERFPYSLPRGALGEVRLKPGRRKDVMRDARALPPFDPSSVFAFTQEIYLLRARRALLEWYLLQAGPKDADVVLNLKTQLDALR